MSSPGLASFAGELCRRHSQMIDCRPILHYITNQLRAGNPKDLIILREIISAMTAIDPLANLSDNQVSAMGGSATLRSEAIHPTVPTLKAPPLPGVEVRAEPIVEKRGVTNKSSVKLMTSLEEDGLVLPLLIAVAQARESCVFTVSEEDAHMKHLSSLFDSVRLPALPLMLSKHELTLNSSPASVD
jgi:THO complex subunit 2